MPFELWGATGTVSLAFPDRPLGYLLLLLYGLLSGYLYRASFRKLSSRQWLLVAGFSLASLVTSQLFPIHLSSDRTPLSVLTLFAAVPFLLAGVILDPAAALIVGLSGGLGRALGQTHQLFDLFHFALAGWLAAMFMRQNYLGRVYQWLRQPAVSGALSTTSVFLLAGIARFASVDSAHTSNLAALDLALSTAAANFWPLLIEGAFGGGIVMLILMGLPDLRPQNTLTPSPYQQSLYRRLLGNYILFAALLVVLQVTVVFSLSVSVSRKLVVNQMAHNAQTVSAEIADFQALLRSSLLQYSSDESLLSGDAAAIEVTLRQLHRANPLYSSVLLVDAGRIIGVAPLPADEDPVALTDQEQTAVTTAFITGVPEMTADETGDDERIISLVVPILDAEDKAVAALVGRVPRPSLANLIVGLQGTMGMGAGFILDEDGRIIAHPDSALLLKRRNPTKTGRLIGAEQTGSGAAYQVRQEETGTRALVYELAEEAHPWTVVLTVPYEVVLDHAWRIGWPSALVLVLVTAAFYANFALLGRDITNPLAELVEAARTIAAGGRWPFSSNTQRDDEVGQLNKAFAQMQRSMNQRLNELSLLLGISHDVSTSIDINQGMPAILRGTLRGTGAAGARAVVFNPSGSHPLTFGEGPAATVMAALDRPLMSQLRHTSELALATPDQIRAALELDEAAAPPVPALIAIPLHSHDRFQGILWLGYRQPHSFDLTERNLLRTLAGQAAVLVENARLFATAEGGRRRLAAVLASTSDAVIVTDQTERILLINRAMEKTFHLKATEVIGRPITDVIKHKQLVKALTGVEEHVRNLEIPTSEGQIFYTSASTIISNTGQVMGRVAVLHDITHFKEVDEMKSDFVATVSHDLRGPLTFMRGYITMLPMIGEFNEKQKEYANKILNGIDQMSNLVTDLLDLGRIEAGVELRCDSIEVEPLLSDVATEYWQHAHLEGIKLNVEVAPGIPIINGDSTLIRRAIVNLVMNGIKYAPNSGSMTLGAEQLNGEVVISVQDHGPGIPQEHLIRLFEKFYRAKEKGTEKIKGSGLGLAIVRSIAERHGGRAWCHSRPGRGSTFYISLPMQPKET